MGAARVIAIGVLVTSMLLSACSPDRTPAASPTECVILLHGLARTAHSMQRMQRALERSGYFVANVDYEFIVDNTIVVGAPPTLARVSGAAAAAVIGTPILAADPNRLRSVIVSLSARTPEQNPHQPWPYTGARTSSDPFTHYRVSTVVPGSARVRTMVAEVPLPNISNRMIRP